MACPRTVHETVCVDALVTIRPEVTVGTIVTFCDGDPIIDGCEGTLQPFCTFRVGQSICVQIPLTFNAIATAAADGIICGDPENGNCSQAPTGCTHSQGFYRTHEDFTASLIELAGGSIVLGNDSMGASFTVNTGNVGLVFSGDVPVPPAPTDNNFNAQYDALYIQLLAARLNQLNGATCQLAQDIIDEANAFLASSPATGQAGAPALTAQLTLFNEGNLGDDCPEHCPDDEDGNGEG